MMHIIVGLLGIVAAVLLYKIIVFVFEYCDAYIAALGLLILIFYYLY